MTIYIYFVVIGMSLIYSITKLVIELETDTKFKKAISMSISQH
jgi:hypothetical protein